MRLDKEELRLPAAQSPHRITGTLDDYDPTERPMIDRLFRAAADLATERAARAILNWIEGYEDNLRDPDQRLRVGRGNGIDLIAEDLRQALDASQAVGVASERAKP